jgi:hypothetical protein
MRHEFGAAYGAHQAILLVRTPWPWSMGDQLARILCKLSHCRWCNSTWGNRLERLQDRHADEFRAPVDDATLTAFQIWMGWRREGDD